MVAPAYLMLSKRSCNTEYGGYKAESTISDRDALSGIA